MHSDNKKSKIRNNPVKTIVIDDDNRAGSYPANIPAGSTLADPIYFNDRDTIETPSAYPQARFKIVKAIISEKFQLSVSILGYATLRIWVNPEEPIQDSDPNYYVDVRDLRTESEIESGAPVSFDEFEVIRRTSIKIVEKIKDVDRPIDASLDSQNIITLKQTVPTLLRPSLSTPSSTSISPLRTVSGDIISSTSPLFFERGSDSNVYAPL